MSTEEHLRWLFPFLAGEVEIREEPYLEPNRPPAWVDGIAFVHSFAALCAEVDYYNAHVVLGTSKRWLTDNGRVVDMPSDEEMAKRLPILFGKPERRKPTTSPTTTGDTKL